MEPPLSVRAVTRPLGALLAFAVVAAINTALAAAVLTPALRAASATATSPGTAPTTPVHALPAPLRRR